MISSYQSAKLNNARPNALYTKQAGNKAVTR